MSGPEIPTGFIGRSQTEIGKSAVKGAITMAIHKLEDEAVKLKRIVGSEAFNKTSNSLPGILIAQKPAPLANRKRKKAVSEELVDELTDYICDHVTESLRPVQEAIEKKMIIRALHEAGGSQKEAAKILGLKYTTLNYKVKKHKLRIRKIITAS